MLLHQEYQMLARKYSYNDKGDLLGEDGMDVESFDSD
jgi:hypothetical protein